MHACTAIMGNFLPHARVLAQSIHEHHADARVTVLVVDDEDGSGAEPFDVVRPSDLGLDCREIHRILTLFDGALPAGAFRGALVRSLLQVDAEPILFLDPDTRVFASLDDLSRLAAQHGVVLSPHFLDSPDHHGGFAGDRELLFAGAFNSGLMAVGPRGAEFLDWWAERLQRWTLLAPADGYYGVQRWLDLVPAMFPHHVLEDPGCNVMTINARERSLSVEEGRWLARGCPLRLFHFGGGFDPLEPYLSSVGYAPEEALLSEHGCLAELHRGYAEALLANGWSERRSLPPPIELRPGVSLDPTMRDIYREALLESERAGTAEPPNPYEPSAAAFMEWLRAPSDLRRKACTVSRYLNARWQRDNLSGEFPDLVDADAARYVDWAQSTAGAAAGVPPSLAEPVMPCHTFIPMTRQGINVVAADGGVGAFVGKCVALELLAAREHVIDVRYPREESARTQVSSELAEGAVNDATVICLRPGLVPDFDYDLGVLFRPERIVIVAVVDSVFSPQDLTLASQIADEVWCWDLHTAQQIGDLRGAHAETLPFPASIVTRRVGAGQTVCWADLGEPGHAKAVTECVSSYLQGECRGPAGLHVYLSDRRADPLTFETIWGLSEMHEHLTVHRAAGWHEAVAHADTLLSLGSGVGPVEAEALSAGVDLITNAESLPRFGLQSAGMFGAAAVDRLNVLRAKRAATS